MAIQDRPLAAISGASTGIGHELARIAAERGYDLVIAANEPEIEEAAREFRALGARVEAVEADLATTEGVDAFYHRIQAFGRPLDVLMANAGRGLKDAFLKQDFTEVRHVIDTNITGTIYLLQKVGRDMQSRGEGKILITGSIAGFTPGAFHAVYNATKAFIDSFSFALREEIKDSGVTVTCLMPGATETAFFERADLEDTKLGQAKKDGAREVAEIGFDAMLRGDGDIVSGWKNKLQSALANVTPSGMLAHQHAKMAEPGSGKN